MHFSIYMVNHMTSSHHKISIRASVCCVKSPKGKIKGEKGGTRKNLFKGKDDKLLKTTRETSGRKLFVREGIGTLSI